MSGWNPSRTGRESDPENEIYLLGGFGGRKTLPRGCPRFKQHKTLSMAVTDGVSVNEAPQLKPVRCASVPWTARVGNVVVYMSSGLGQLSPWSPLPMTKE